MSSTLDFTFIRELMGNDEKLVHKFVTIFKDQCPRQLKELTSHYANQNWQALSNVAHSLKTQFTYLSLEVLADQVLEIETRAEEKPGTELHVEELGGLVRAFETELNELLINTQLPS